MFNTFVGEKIDDENVFGELWVCVCVHASFTFFGGGGGWWFGQYYLNYY